jgi:PadR family transcriptional regulator AphA
MNLQYAILGMLTIASMNGYSLKKIFSKSVNYFWPASLSQIYRELGALEKKGLVSSIIEAQEDRPDKRVYSITEAGNQAFLDWLTHFPDELSSVKRDEFSLRIFFGSKLGRVELKKQFERFISDRKKIIQTMAEDKKTIVETTQAIKKVAEQDMCMRFITRRAQLTNELLIQWAEECIQELDNTTFTEDVL